MINMVLKNTSFDEPDCCLKVISFWCCLPISRLSIYAECEDRLVATASCGQFGGCWHLGTSKNLIGSRLNILPIPMPSRGISPLQQRERGPRKYLPKKKADKNENCGVR